MYFEVLNFSADVGVRAGTGTGVSEEGVIHVISEISCGTRTYGTTRKWHPGAASFRTSLHCLLQMGFVVKKKRKTQT